MCFVHLLIYYISFSSSYVECFCIASLLRRYCHHTTANLCVQVEDCEKAYFKMDNVLIDDRRIHVDFSQSVSKIKWKGKGMWG